MATYDHVVRHELVTADHDRAAVDHECMTLANTGDIANAGFVNNRHQIRPKKINSGRSNPTILALPLCAWPPGLNVLCVSMNASSSYLSWPDKLCCDTPSRGGVAFHHNTKGKPS